MNCHQMNPQKLGRLRDWMMNKRLSTSLTATAETIGSTIEETKRFCRRLASLIIHHDHSCRQQVEFSFAKAEHLKRLVISDNNTEYETPMALSVSQQLRPPPEFVRTVVPDGIWCCCNTIVSDAKVDGGKIIFQNGREIGAERNQLFMLNLQFRD